MKKINFIILIFLMSINIFSKTGVEKEVEKIREEFTKINSEKNYKVESIYDVSGEILMEYYRKMAN
jgi:outer membrane protein P13